MTRVFKKEAEVEWENHFMVDGAKLQWLYTKEKDDSPITVMKVLLQKGVTLPDHRHPDSARPGFILSRERPRCSSKEKESSR